MQTFTFKKQMHTDFLETSTDVHTPKKRSNTDVHTCKTSQEIRDVCMAMSVTDTQMVKRAFDGER